MTIENDITLKSLIVEEIFNPSMVQAIYKELMATRKCVGDDQFTYDPIERTIGGKTYTIEATHLQIGEVMGYAKSNCNKCYGTGRTFRLMDKGEIKNPEDFLMIASTSLKDLTEEQKQVVIDREKQSKNWKVLLPCSCTIKGMNKKGRKIISNDMLNIIAEISCTEKI
jgi:hypothetical protein